MADIAQLAGFVPEPYQKTAVLDAARSSGQPFTLRDITAQTGLPPHVVNRVLHRCVKQRILTKRKIAMTYPAFTRHGWRWIPGGRQRRVWLYSFVAGR